MTQTSTREDAKDVISSGDIVVTVEKSVEFDNNEDNFVVKENTAEGEINSVEETQAKQITGENSSLEHEQDQNILMESKDNEENRLFEQFNANPQLGFQPLCQYFDIEDNSCEIAHLFRSDERINTEALSRFFELPASEDVLFNYILCVKLKNDFLEAFRNFLDGPLLIPSSTDGIEQYIKVFANSYSYLRSGGNFTSDVSYFMAYGLLLLNKNLNEKGHPKFTQKQFIKSIRVSINFKLAPSNLLIEYFDSVRTDPLRSSNLFFTFEIPSMEGKLKKKTDHLGSKWTSHYFSLSNKCLYYFEGDQKKGNPIGMVQLLNVEVISVISSQQHRIKIKSQDDIIFIKYKKGKPVFLEGIKWIKLEAPTRINRNKWLREIKKSGMLAMFDEETPDGMVPSIVYVE